MAKNGHKDIDFEKKTIAQIRNIKSSCSQKETNFTMFLNLKT